MQVDTSTILRRVIAHGPPANIQNYFLEYPRQQGTQDNCRWLENFQPQKKIAVFTVATSEVELQVATSKICRCSLKLQKFSTIYDPPKNLQLYIKISGGKRFWVTQPKNAGGNIVHNHLKLQVSITGKQENCRWLQNSGYFQEHTLVELQVLQKFQVRTKSTGGY